VVYVTAYVDKDTLKRAKKTEPYGFIYKPFKAEDLKAVIETALYKHEMDNKLRERDTWLDAILQALVTRLLPPTQRGGLPE